LKETKQYNYTNKHTCDYKGKEAGNFRSTTQKTQSTAEPHSKIN